MSEAYRDQRELDAHVDPQLRAHRAASRRTARSASTAATSGTSSRCARQTHGVSDDRAPLRGHAGTGRPARRRRRAAGRLLTSSSPDAADPAERVSFGTSGHRGLVAHRRRSTRRTSWRSRRRSASTGTGSGIDGPLFLGMDTHALSEPAFATALEVLAANGVETMIDDEDGYTPTPVDLARHPDAQPRPHDRAGRRHRHHAVAQPARGRRLQVQPAERRPGRHGDHALDRGPGERAAGERRSSGVPRIPYERARRRADDAPARLRRRVRRAISPRSSTWTPFAAPASASASIRWAAPASPSGRAIAERYGLGIEVVNDESIRPSAS